MGIMSTRPAASDENGFHVVVAEDGSVRAADLAARGVRPGAHLRVVPEQRPSGRRGGSAGKLAGSVAQDVIDDFIAGLEESKAERRAFNGTGR
jgi:hypothetical protein